MTAPAPAAPAVARRVFAARLPLAVRYADLLCGAGVLRGLVGPHERERVWSRHLLNSAALAALIPTGADVVDVGSGAGLPGIPLALARPDLRVTLVEPMGRRVEFLREVVAALGLAVSVVQGRAPDVAVVADVVVARAVAPLERLVPAVAPLVRPGGLVLALKGRTAEEELARARRVLRRWPAAEASIEPLEVDNDVTYAVRLCLEPAGARTARAQAR